MKVAIGGLGGGGDVGGVFAFPKLVWAADSTVLSFNRCNPKHIKGELVGGSLVRIDAGYNHGKRFFEDKLFEIGIPAGRVFVVCLKSGWNDVLRGIDKLVEMIPVGYMLHVDLGGDGLVLGYEEGLGSYIQDTLARAALYYASKEYGVRSHVAIGLLGLEGGGDVLNMYELVGDLLYLNRIGILEAVYTPGSDERTVWSISQLLKRGESGMLAILLDVMRGYKGKKKYNILYLKNKTVQIEEFHRNFYILNTKLHCEASPVCNEAFKHGKSGIKHYARKTPPKELARIYTEAKRNWPTMLADLQSKLPK